MDRTIVLAADTKAAPKEVIDAISTEEGERGFWTADCTVELRTGSTAIFRFPGTEAAARMRVDEIGADVVRWTSLGDFPHWEGSAVTWRTLPAPDGNGTRMLFRHDGFSGDYPEADLGSVAFTWALILDRLQRYLESGTPQPFFG
jgi:hypothetical protein